MPTDMPLQLLILEGDGISHEIMAVGSLAALAGIRFMLYLAGAPDKKRTAID